MRVKLCCHMTYSIIFMGEQTSNEQWMWHNFPVNQMFGVQSSLPNFMADQHFVEDITGAKHYITRLGLFPQQFDGVLAGLQLRQAEGILPPRFAVEKVIKQIDDFVATPVDEHMLLTTFQEKLEKNSCRGSEQRAARRNSSSRLRDRIRQDVYPTYTKLNDYFAQPAVHGHQQRTAVWRLPSGDAFYAQQVREHTTTDMTPDEVHQLGPARSCTHQQRNGRYLA